MVVVGFVINLKMLNWNCKTQWSISGRWPSSWKSSEGDEICLAWECIRRHSQGEEFSPWCLNQASRQGQEQDTGPCRTMPCRAHESYLTGVSKSLKAGTAVGLLSNLPWWLSPVARFEAAPVLRLRLTTAAQEHLLLPRRTDAPEVEQKSPQQIPCAQGVL